MNYVRAEESGSMIEQILSENRENSQLITLAGQLSISDLSKIKILASETEPNQYSVLMANATIDQRRLPDNQLNFPDGILVKSILLEESIVEGSKDIIFSVIITFSASEKLQPKVLEGFTNEFIQIEMLPQVQAGKSRNETLPSTEPVMVNVEEIPPLEQQWNEANAKVDTLFYRKQSILRLSILNANGIKDRATELSIYLNNKKKKLIEDNLGVRFSVINVSNAHIFDYSQTTIYFRENYLRAALFLASLIPGDQRIAKLHDPERRIGVDLEIYLGKDYK